MSDNTHKQVIIIRKDLNMRKGKIAAQAAHASMGAILKLMTIHPDGSRTLPPDPRVVPWLQGKFTKPVCYVNSEEELLTLQQQAIERGLIECLIVDSGLTEFHGVPTITALAIGPDMKSNVDIVTGHLPLF